MDLYVECIPKCPAQCKHSIYVSFIIIYNGLYIIATISHHFGPLYPPPAALDPQVRCQVSQEWGSGLSLLISEDKRWVLFQISSQLRGLQWCPQRARECFRPTGMGFGEVTVASSIPRLLSHTSIIQGDGSRPWFEGDGQDGLPPGMDLGEGSAYKEKTCSLFDLIAAAQMCLSRERSSYTTEVSVIIVTLKF